MTIGGLDIPTEYRCKSAVNEYADMTNSKKNGRRDPDSGGTQMREVRVFVCVTPKPSVTRSSVCTVITG